jgi:hypothetical protein
MIMILFFFSLGFAYKSCPLIKLHYFQKKTNTCSSNNNTTTTTIFIFFLGLLLILLLNQISLLLENHVTSPSFSLLGLLLTLDPLGNFVLLPKKAKSNNITSITIIFMLSGVLVIKLPYW